MRKKLLQNFIIAILAIILVCAGFYWGNRPVESDMPEIVENEVVVSDAEAGHEITRNAPENGYGAELIEVDLPETVTPGEAYVGSFTFTNTGTEMWPMGKFYLGGKGQVADFYFSRYHTYRHVFPGESVEMGFVLLAPEKNGTYELAFQMIKDDNGAFGDYIAVAIAVKGEAEDMTFDMDNIQLKLSQSDLDAIERLKTESLASGMMRNDFNQWRKIDLSYNDEPYQEAKFKIHGDTGYHYEREVKSYNLKLSKKATIDSRRRFRMISLVEREFFSLANGYLSEVLDVFILDHKLVFGSVNKGPYNLYYWRDGKTKETLERNNFSNASFIKKPFFQDTLLRYLITTARAPGHQTYVDFEISNQEIEGSTIDPRKVYYSLYLLQKAIQEGSDQVLFDFFDYDYMVDFQALHSILLTTHDIDGDNLTLIYRETDGKFYPMVGGENVNAYGDIAIESSMNRINKNGGQAYIFARMNRDDNFRQAKYRRIYEILKDEEVIKGLTKVVARQDKSIMAHDLRADNYPKINERKLVHQRVFYNMQLLKHELEQANMLIFGRSVGGKYIANLNTLAISEIDIQKAVLNFSNPLRAPHIPLTVTANGKTFEHNIPIQPGDTQVDITQYLNMPFALELSNELTPEFSEVIVALHTPHNVQSFEVEAVNTVTGESLNQENIMHFDNESSYWHTGNDLRKKHFYYDPKYHVYELERAPLSTEEEKEQLHNEFVALWKEVRKDEVDTAVLREEFASTFGTFINLGHNETDERSLKVAKYELNLAKMWISVVEYGHKVQLDVLPLAISRLSFSQATLKFDSKLPKNENVILQVENNKEEVVYEKKFKLEKETKEIDLAEVLDEFEFKVDRHRREIFPTKYHITLAFQDGDNGNESNMEFPHLEEVEFTVKNPITGKSAKEEDIVYAIADATNYFQEEKFLTLQQVLETHDFFQTRDTNLILEGEVDINKTVIIPHGTQLIIEPGTTITIAPDVSLLSYSPVQAIGTKEAPIKVEAKDPEKPFDVFAVVGPGANGTHFSDFHIENGSEAHLNGMYLSGMLDVYHVSDVIVENSVFRKAQADDALNFKYVDGVVTNSLFEKNSSDAIDFDFVKGEISSNTFIKNGNDAIDISGTHVPIRNNIVKKSGDKCMSIGENSSPLIINNIMDGCAIGVEVKDLSAPIILNNLIINNEIGINSYQKKRHFGSAHATVYNTLFYGNEKKITFKNMFAGQKLPSDESDITIQYSSLPGGYKGKGNISERPQEDTYFLEGKGNRELILNHIPDYEGEARIGLLTSLDTPK